MSVVEPVWIDGKKERRTFFCKELNEFLDALEGTADTYDTFDEVGLDMPQLFPDYTSPEMKKIKEKRYFDAVDKMNRRGDEWDRMNPSDKCKRVPIK